MDTKSPEINQHVSAGCRDLRVSANSAGSRESKNRFSIYMYSIFRRIFLIKYIFLFLEAKFIFRKNKIKIK
jgi:hypothetical protein